MNLKELSVSELLRRLDEVQGEIELDHQDYRALDREKGKLRDDLIDELLRRGKTLPELGYFEKEKRR